MLSGIHVPMEILGFRVKREHIRQDRIHACGNDARCRMLEIGRVPVIS